MRSLFGLLLLLAACRTPPLDVGDGGAEAIVDLAGPNGGSHDLAAPRDLHATPSSCCGAAGNPGNELGVGRFCMGSLDCPSTANVCATTFSPNLTFCTRACAMNGPSGQCGSGAQCQCASGQCACVPGECLMPPPGC